jgi:hypothetical protein
MPAAGRPSLSPTQRGRWPRLAVEEDGAFRSTIPDDANLLKLQEQAADYVQSTVTHQRLVS